MNIARRFISEGRRRYYDGVIAVNRFVYNCVLRRTLEPVAMPQKPLISFCTTCMGRASYLKQALPENIETCRSYGNVEFVVLNYNSSDDLDDWMRAEMADAIRNGVVSYYRTTEPQYYDSAHSKNVAKKVARGDVVCNIDADSYVGKGFTEFLAAELGKDVRQVFYGDWAVQRGSGGKIAVAKAYFLAAGGYLEKLQGYSYDDTDFVERLVRMGLRRRKIRNREFLQLLENTNDERVCNFEDDSKDVHAWHRMNKKIGRCSMYLWNYRANRRCGFGNCGVEKVTL